MEAGAKAIDELRPCWRRVIRSRGDGGPPLKRRLVMGIVLNYDRGIGYFNNVTWMYRDPNAQGGPVWVIKYQRVAVLNKGVDLDIDGTCFIRWE